MPLFAGTAPSMVAKERQKMRLRAYAGGGSSDRDAYASGGEREGGCVRGSAQHSLLLPSRRASENRCTASASDSIAGVRAAIVRAVLSILRAGHDARITSNSRREGRAASRPKWLYIAPLLGLDPWTALESTASAALWFASIAPPIDSRLGGRAGSRPYMWLRTGSAGSARGEYRR
jgi:hypothetical protein